MLCALAIFTSVYAADIATFRAGQAVARHPEIKVYVDAVDQAGKAVDSIPQTQITATLGQIQVDVKEVTSFDKSSEGVGYVFLVDISRSLSASQFDQMKAAINLWIDKMRDSDRAAIISFGEKVTTVQDFTADRNALKNGVKTLTVSDNKTQLHQGIAKGIELSRRVYAGLPTRRVIVTLSDGEDDFPGGMTRDEVLANMKDDRIPIYAVGVSQKGQKGDANRKKLGEFARMSGGEFYDGNVAEWAKLYDAIQQKILKSFLVKLDAAKVPADGKSNRLQLTLNSGGKSMTDGLDLRLLAKTVAPVAVKEQPKPWYKMVPVLSYALSGGGLLVLIIALVVRAKQRKTARLAAEEADKKRRAELEAARKKGVADAAARDAEKKLKDEQLTVKKASPPGLNMKLSVLGSGGDQRDYGITLSSRAFIGRSSTCDLSITNDEEISNRHCELVMEGGYVLINDLNSTNGTFVNGVPVKTGHRLKSGDLVMLGRTEMRIAF
jgi:Mg-chelatase subunit ChlD